MANLKSVLKCWSDFNLPSLQKSLDETATETAQRQGAAEKAKKQLIELTKGWRKNTEEDVRTKAAPLIKAFQKEIDSLNKRSKSAENSFLLLYKNLLEIPDPVPALKQAEVIKRQLEKAKDFELENQKLRETLDEYHHEFAEVKNQDVTINKLKEKLKEYEDEAEKKLQGILEDKEKEMQSKYDEREKQLLDSKLQLATKLGDVEAKMKTITETLQKSESDVFDLKSKHEEELMAKNSEIELLESDLERANQNLLAAEKFSESLNTQYQNELTQQNTSTTSLSNEFDVETIRALEHQLLSKERELSQLMQEIHHQQSMTSKAKDNARKEIDNLELSLAERNKAIEDLEKGTSQDVDVKNQKSEIEKQTDYEEVKRELSVLKLIEFSGGDDEDQVDMGRFKDVEVKVQSPKAKPLEKLLVEKNKSKERILNDEKGTSQDVDVKNQSECTMLKVQNSEFNRKHDEMQKNCNTSLHTITEQKELIKQLEADLMNVRGYTSAYRGEGVGAPAPPSINTEFMSKAVQDIHTDEVDELDKQTADSLLPIIASQRERFRTKNLELESKSRDHERKIQSLQDEVDTVRHDNVKLYEKIKFLQSYPNNKSDNSTINIDDDSTKKYSSQYEERIDPFSVFSRKEKQQRYSNLSGPEKVTLNMVKHMLSKDVNVNVQVLYKFAYTEPCKRIMAQTAVGHISDQMYRAFGNNNLAQHVDPGPHGAIRSD